MLIETENAAPVSLFNVTVSALPPVLMVSPSAVTSVPTTVSAPSPKFRVFTPLPRVMLSTASPPSTSTAPSPRVMLFTVVRAPATFKSSVPLSVLAIVTVRDPAVSLTKASTSAIVAPPTSVTVMSPV